LFFDGGVGAVEDAADGRAVLRGEGALIFELLHYHGGEDMRFFEGCTALITGASSGLGAEFARQLAPVAEKLVLVARRGEHLDALKTDLETRHTNVRVFVYVMDLTRENQTRDFVEWLEREKIRINFLVNNAGMGDRGPFATGDWTKIHDMLELNIVALTRLTHHLLPMLLEGGRGAVLNVSSIAGLIPLPHMSVYAATKAYVNSFSDGLRMELRDTGISVTAVLPGPVETEFGQVASRGTGEPEWKTPDDLTLPAAEVVRSALSAVAADKARVIPGWKLVLLMGIAVALPLGILRAVLQRKVR
jgi:short-subunit dehydrogenase